MLNFMAVVGWAAVGAVVGVLVTRAAYRHHIVTAGRAARAPVCSSCPFVSEDVRAEILKGNTVVPPSIPLPMFDLGSGLHKPV